MIVQAMMEEYTGTSTKIILSSDNDSTLDATFDLVQAAINICTKLKSTIHTEHVLGHADIKRKNRNATGVKLLNQSCDVLAKYMRAHTTPIGSKVLYGEGLSIWKGDIKLYHDFNNLVTDIYYARQAALTLCEKFQWNMEQYNMVNWKLNKKAMQILSTYSTLWISKFVTGFLPTGTNMERHNERTQEYCPRCKTHEEIRDHIIQCDKSSTVDLYR